MRYVLLLLLLLSVFLLTYSCIPLKDRKLLQPDDKLELNEYGLISPPVLEHRLKIGDILTLNLITRDPGAADKFGRQYTTGITNPSEGAYYLNGLVIDKEGNIEIPRLGKINLYGKTIEQAQKALTELFTRTEYQENSIYIRVQLAGINYTVQGEVGRPGFYQIFRERINILEVLARSGDFTEVADRKRVKLLRQELNGLRIVELDLTKESIMNSEYFYLQPNDQIIVNPKLQKTLGTGTRTLSTIATTLGLLASIYSTYIILQRL